MLELTHKIKAQATDLSLSLNYEQRSKSRLRANLDQGGEVGIFLPRGSRLNDGDCLAGHHGQIVKVVAAAECVSEACCQDTLRFARACYHLGNRHVPLQISPPCVRYLEDQVLDEMMRSLGLQPISKQLPFEPEAGAYDEQHRHSAE